MEYVILFNPKTGDVREEIFTGEKVEKFEKKGYIVADTYNSVYTLPLYFTYYCKRCKEWHIEIYDFQSKHFAYLKDILKRTSDCKFYIIIQSKKRYDAVMKIIDVAYGKIPNDQLADFLGDLFDSRISWFHAKYHETAKYRKKVYRILRKGEYDKLLDVIKRYIAEKILRSL